MFRKYEKVFAKDYENWYKESTEYRKQTEKDPRRLHFHLMPRTGWMNDPNGLCQLNGVYHIFYQYTPFEPTGELKLWGHFTTRDFIHYEDDGPVLYPDSELDAHGAYSGSAYVEDGTMYVFYTGNLKYFDREDYDYINSGRGSNTIQVVSRDGHHFSRKKLLMTTADYPADMSCHVRDPKVFRRGARYYMVLGARDRESRGLVLLYESDDLEHWTFKSRIMTEEKFGYMWECPDLFEIDGQMFLTCCPQGVAQQGVDYANVHQCVWMKLDCNFAADQYRIRQIHQLDRGTDFYAPQTFQDEQGRRILIGWMGIPDADYTNPTTEAGWQHALTLPRELTVRDGKLIQQPIAELRQLRCEPVVCGSFDQDGCAECVSEAKPQVYEASVTFDRCQSMRMELRDGVTLYYQDHMLTLDPGDRGAGRTARSVRLECLEDLQIFADTSSVEIFVNHGEEVFTSRIYSMEGGISIQGICEGKMVIYPLKSFNVEDIWNDEE
ncbi:MAG: glycoside hydrolase family 32 protein [Lachnospiraceae bacterium]|nr:glycoside hydrolase family 32 protein [Lachnospiraceae bacterium]